MTGLSRLIVMDHHIAHVHHWLNSIRFTVDYYGSFSKDPTFVVFIGFMGVAGRFFVRMTQTALDLEDFVLRQRILSDWK